MLAKKKLLLLYEDMFETENEELKYKLNVVNTKCSKE